MNPDGLIQKSGFDPPLKVCSVSRHIGLLGI